MINLDSLVVIKIIKTSITILHTQDFINKITESMFGGNSLNLTE